MSTGRLLLSALALLTLCAAAACARAEAGEPPRSATPAVLIAAVPEPALRFGPSADYRLVRERTPRQLPALQVSRVIGVFGGSVALGGHSLAVPRGAVTLPTVFNLTVLPTGNVEVEVEALVTTLLGRTVNAGALGFRRPVELTLSWDRAEGVSAASRLAILQLDAAAGGQLVTGAVDAARRTITVRLEHLARYRLVELSE